MRCLEFYKNHDSNWTKLGSRGIKCEFVGYTSHSKAYRLLKVESNVIIKFRDVKFFEYVLTLGKIFSPSSIDIIIEKNSQGIVEQSSL